MATPRHAFLLVSALFLAGCTFGGGGNEENTEVVDKSEYDGGIGFAILVRNTGQDPFDVTVRVLGAGGSELGRIEETIQGGHSLEKWWSLEMRSTYSARMEFTWRGATGSTSKGTDEQTFSAQDCPDVSLLTWELRQSENVVGHAFLGKTCVEGEAAASQS